MFSSYFHIFPKIIRIFVHQRLPTYLTLIYYPSSTMIHQDLAMFSQSTPGDHGCHTTPAQALACRAPLQGRAKGATRGQGEEANGEGDLEKRDG